MCILGSHVQRLLVALLLGWSAPAVADGSYLCIAEMSTGFAFDTSTKQWQVARFDVTKVRYIVKFTDKDATWNHFGSPLPPQQCSPFDNKGYTVCLDPSGWEHVTFNRINLKYQLVYLAGWIGSDLPSPDKSMTPLWNYFQKNPDTPYIEIGRCSAL